MAREADNYYVDLTNDFGIDEVLPYLYRLATTREKGIFTSPSGIGFFKEDRYHHHVLSREDIVQILDEYIFDISESGLLSAVASTLCFILCNPENPSRLNPYSPDAEHLLSQFLEYANDGFIQMLMKKLWEYAEKENIRFELQKLVKTRIEIRVLGQLASGKTTFLDTILRELALDRINIRKSGTEPEDVEQFYPEYRVVNHYMASRYNLRSGATLGSEYLRLFGVDSGDQKVVEVEVHSSGGHVHAERPPSYHDFGATAFFIDYQLIQELQTLEKSTDMNKVLCNGETVLQSVLSLLSRLCEWEEVNGPKLAVVSKLPTETELTEDVLTLIDLAYKCVIKYARAHQQEINEEAIYLGGDIRFPKDEKMSTSTTNWKAIRNDAPTYTGTMDVLNELLSLVNGETHITLISIDDQANKDNTVFYKDVL